jgi:signal transduction histidine kinase
VIKPWDRTELEETLRWAVEAYVAGRHNNALQLRLIQTERLRTLGQVSAAVLHDLNQPVMAVSMSAEQLGELSKIAPTLGRIAKGEHVVLTAAERSTMAMLGEELPELASSLATCATFMADLMKQMRLFQRHDTAPPASGDVDPGPVLKLALSMCRSGSITGGSRLIYEGPQPLPRVRATSTDLMQVMVNLVRNAQQALEENHVHEGVVNINATVSDGLLVITVKDNGPGIPPDVLAKLGTPFYTTRDAGTGLGIAQCKRLVGRLGGEMRIESAPGNGTVVTFTLPTVH